MMAARRQVPLIDRLPAVRGGYEPDARLGRFTWFRVGGPADVLFTPADADDLAAFLAATPRDIPVSVLGIGSNVLVRDGGIRGVVIRLGRSFARLRVGGTLIEAGAAALDPNVAKAARDAGIAGLEFLSGVPGSVGGGLRMNAGAYGGEFAGIVESARAVDRDGVLHDVEAAGLGFAYRHCAAPRDWIFLSARLRGRPGDAGAIATRMAEIMAAREESQPIRLRTGGSTFKNPVGASAWELIDRAGCRGLRRGKAMVSEKHCNFLVNTGGATAADLEALGEEVRRRVQEQCGIDLHWEIDRVGDVVTGLREVGQ